MILKAILKKCLSRSEFIYFEGAGNMAKDTHHVVHNPNGGWDVKRGGGQRASAHVGTKAEAERIGRKISRNQGTE